MTDQRKDTPHEGFSEIRDITPDLALAWLDHNEGNRPINWNYVAQLVRDMTAGRYACTHQGIAFDTSGRLIDGQHRLWAIVKAKVSVRMRVFFNEPPANVVYLDGNHPRRAAERMTLSGLLGTVRADELATLRTMLAGLSMVYKRRTVHEEMALLARHRPAVHFAHENLSATRLGGIANCMTRGAVARAWYSAEEPARLTRFCEVLRTGLMTTDFERPIVLLRDELLTLHKRSTKKNRQRQYALTARTLRAYLQLELLTVLRPPRNELFFLPDEAELPT